jgi:hypothetical protein
MDGWHTRSMRTALSSFAIAMVGLAVWAWLRFGLSVVTAVAVALAVACVAAMAYALWLGRRVLGPLDQMRGGAGRRDETRR